jgi:hypothetical protein
MNGTLDLSKCCPGRETYTLPRTCSNCGWIGRLVIAKGHRAPGGFDSARCPVCDCKTVSAGRWGA